jgi:glyoxylase-like metal-dependent hydrolase (beta-lactamase superfamily II)
MDPREAHGAALDLAGLPAAPDVQQIDVGLLQNFCTLLHCPDTREAAIVDPAWEPDRLLAEARRHDLTVTAILVTHTHHDHIEAVGEVVRATGARVVVHPNEAAALRAALGELSATIVPLADRLDLAIGRRGVRALETPGHTVGGTCFLADGFVVTGDVLFVRGCGRTDFPGGDTAALWRSLQRLVALPEETRVYPGHDYGPTPTSTIGAELLENPYLRCATFEAFRELRERKRRA